MSKNKWYKQSIPLWLLLLLVSGAWGAYWFFIMVTSIEVEKNSSIWAIRGQFGDMFGALNALFSGLAFAGIIFTIRQQKEELELQREELKMTREELAKSADAQKKSEEALNKQAVTMKLTAMLNANKSLLDYYQNISNSEKGIFSMGQIHAPNDAKNCVDTIQNILRKLENQG